MNENMKEATDLLLDVLAAGAIVTGNVAAAAAVLQAAIAAGRALTDDEKKQARAVSAMKRAALEAA